MESNIKREAGNFDDSFSCCCCCCCLCRPSLSYELRVNLQEFPLRLRAAVAAVLAHTAGVLGQALVQLKKEI